MHALFTLGRSQWWQIDCFGPESRLRAGGLLEKCVLSENTRKEMVQGSVMIQTTDCTVLSSSTPPCITSADQKDIGGHPDHHPGHGNHWGLWCVRVFPPQPIHRVGQVYGVRDVPQQTQHCQEKGQPAGDRAVLLHGERRGCSWIPDKTNNLK